MKCLRGIGVALAVTLLAGVAHAQQDPMQRGRTAERSGDFRAAEMIYDAAVRDAPTDAALWHRLGLVRAFQAQYDAALEALEKAESLAPGDLDIALSIARVHGFAGRYAEADRRVDAVIARNSKSMEAWTLKGRIASYQKKYPEARAAFDLAAGLGAPDTDLLIAYGDLARATGNEDTARGYFEEAAALDPNSVEARERLASQRPTETPTWTATISGGKSWLSRTPAPDWTAADAVLERIDGRARMFGGVSYARRFRADDVMIRAGAARNFGASSLSFEGGVTPDADVLAKWQLFASGTARLARGGSDFGPSVAVLDGQLRHYGAGTVKTLSPGVDQYLADGRLMVSARVVNTWDTNDKHLLGWSAASVWQASNVVGIRAGYANAPEAERGTVADTRTVSGGLIITASERLTWRIDVAEEHREGGYRRFEAIAGITTRF